MSDSPDYFPELPKSDTDKLNEAIIAELEASGEIEPEFDADTHEGDGAIIRFVLHLNTGQDVEVYIHDPEIEVDTFNEVKFLESMAADLNADRPQWAQLGNCIFFSGAVSAIECEEHLA